MYFRSNAHVLGASILLFALWLPLTAHCLEDEDAPAYREKLGKLQESIAEGQKNLKGTRNRRSHIITDLRRLEINISNNARKLNTLEKNIQQLNTRITRLKKELKAVSLKLNKQRDTLTEQIRSAYALGTQESIKIALSQQNPAELGRQQVYFNYLSKARQQEIIQFITAMEVKKTRENDLKQSLADQQTALEKRKFQRNALKKQRVKRSQLLAQLEKKIKNQEQTLSELETSRTKIEDLLMSLGELLADIPVTSGNKGPFKQLKGRLPWPIKGTFLAHYGQKKDRGGLKWNGILIAADYGTPVRAISHGRIAFADWLQGFGFISIIDHGDGYMSLYGHNETLLKQAGDWVNAGDEIATSGDSGGQPTPGLYFEIRSSGKPVNPDAWCSNKFRHAKSD